MDPDQHYPGQKFSPNQPEGDESAQSTPVSVPKPTTVPPAVAIYSSGRSDKSRKRIFIIAGGTLSLLFLVIVIVALSAGGKKPSVQAPSKQAPEGPQAAESIDVQQINNSINQDISELDDQADFPETQLDDRSLGL